MGNMLTVKELQTKFNLGKNKAYKLVHTKGFPTIKIGKTILIPEEQLQLWVEDNLNSQIYV